MSAHPEVPTTGVGPSHPPRLGAWIAALVEDLLGIPAATRQGDLAVRLRPLAGLAFAGFAFVALLAFNAWVRTEFVQVTRNIDTQKVQIKKAIARNDELRLEIGTRSGRAAMDAAVVQWGLVPAPVERAAGAP